MDFLDERPVLMPPPRLRHNAVREAGDGGLIERHRVLQQARKVALDGFGAALAISSSMGRGIRRLSFP